MGRKQNRMATSPIDDKIISSHALKEELSKLPEEKILSTGYYWLDQCIEGFALGDLVVIVGEPKTGKSLYAMSISARMAKLGAKSLWIQAELSYTQFIKRFKGDMPMFYVPRNLNIPTLTWIEAKIVEAKALGIQVVYIDDLGMLVDEDVFKFKNAQDIYGARIMKLKRFAVRYGVCIVGLWHVDKESSKKVKKAVMRPTDVKGMTDLVYRADTVIGIDRPDKEKESLRVQDVVSGQLIVNKETRFHILVCRRTGARNAYISGHLGEDGYHHEENEPLPEI